MSNITAEQVNLINSSGRELQMALANKNNNKSCLPKPPKKGEIMYCQVCGKAMLPKDFDKNPIIRKKEFKWQTHYKCQQESFKRCDLNTQGLMAERKG